MFLLTWHPTRSSLRFVALLLSCLLVYSRLSTPPTADVHTAALPPMAKHRPPPLTSTPPPLASAAPARRSTAADAPKRQAAVLEEPGAPAYRTMPQEAVHVALAADSHHFQALPGAILSAANRTSAPLAFHVLVPAEQLAAAKRALECFGVATAPTASASASASAVGSLSVEVLPFHSALRAPVRVVAQPDVTGNLASPLNFARFELPRLLPALRRLLYLDADVVVPAAALQPRAAALQPRAASLQPPRVAGLQPRVLQPCSPRVPRCKQTCSSCGGAPWTRAPRWAQSPAPSHTSGTSGTRPSARHSTRRGCNRT